MRGYPRRAPLFLSLLTLAVSVLLSLIFHQPIHHRATAAASTQPAAIAVTSSASYDTNALAPGAIATAFGAALATQVDFSSSLPLPTTLAGTSVSVMDSAGTERLAGLFYVAPTQINFLIPETTSLGAAVITVRASDGKISAGTFDIKAVAPAIFTASGNGQGVPAAVALRVKADGQQIYENVAQFDAVAGRWRPLPLDLSPAGDQVFLLLFLSGTARAADPNNDGNRNESIRLLLGGVETTPPFLGAQGSFAGLDQMNLALPRTLIGSGRINLSITGLATTGGGLTSNSVEIEIAGAMGTAPPTVSGFGTAAALAGQIIEIQGNGFAGTAAENLVRIGGIKAQVTSAAPGQLSVIVPTGVETGIVSVSTPQGEGRSSDALRIRTSISGLVVNTEGSPLKDAVVRVRQNNVNTSGSGAFVLPDPVDTPLGTIVEVDASKLPVSPPFGIFRTLLPLVANRDNQITPAISLQQSYGTSTQVGGQNLQQREALETTLTIPSFAPNESAQTPTQIQTGEVTLTFPANTRFQFADGATSGVLTLTQIEKSRTPVALPNGVFSSTIVQITPFGTKFSPGGQLTFPNADGFAAGVTVRLYRLDQNVESATLGRFIDAGAATVAADGKQIITASGGVTEATYYFVSLARPTTTVVGRVLDSDQSPVQRALVRVRGQEDFTDGNGGFVIRNVPVASNSDMLTVEASLVRPNFRVDRAESNRTATVAGGVTNVGTLTLPAANSNQPPYLLIAPNLTIIAGATSEIPFIAEDPDSGQTIQITLDGPSFATLPTANGRTIRLTPGLNDVGSFSFTLTAVDNLGASFGRAFMVNVVRSANRAPVLTVPDSQTIQPDQLLTFTISATDADAGQTLTYAASNLPANAVFNTAARQFTWTPAASQRGNYTVNFTTTDNGIPPLSDSKSVNIAVVNRPPAATPQIVTTDEDIARAITLAGTDPDGDALTFSLVTQPTRGTLSGTLPNLTFTPNKDANGVDSFTFKVNDGTLDSQPATVDITITPINDAPVLTVPSAQSINEGVALSFTISATDVDTGQTVTLSATNVPSGATFSAASGQFSWTPSFIQAGSYTVNFTATDNGAPSLGDTKPVTITVNDVNRAPVANAQSVTTDEDTPKAITLTASDADGDALGFVIVTNPTRGTLGGTPPNLTYTPNKDANGVDSFTFNANDGKTDSNIATVTLAINPINDAPVLIVPSAQSVNEGVALSFMVSATDVDGGQTITLSAANMPNGATFNAATGQFNWTPNAQQAGNYTVNFTATDNGAPPLSDTKSVPIAVGNVNRPPTATAQTVTTNEDTPVNLTLAGSDPDGDGLTFSLVTQPTRGMLTGTAPNLTYTPAANFNGTDSFTFKVNDGTLDSQPATVTLNVAPINDAPVITVPGAQSINEGLALSFTVSATDVDSSQTITLSATTVPSGATFNAATGQFSWTPSFTQAGNYTVNFTATDNGTPPLSNTKSVLITVGNVNRSPVANAQTVATNEDTPVNLTLTGSDPDGGALTFTIVTNPTRGTLTGTGATRTYTPALNANGTDSFTFRVSDGTLDSQPATVTLNVAPVNDAPVLTVPGAQSVNSGQTLSFLVSATDVDTGQTLTFNAANVPSGATFNAATRQFSWTPNAAQAGSYTVNFTATDNGMPSLSNSKSVTVTVVAVHGTVRGTVRNAVNGTVLAGVALAITNTNLTTISANDGTYLLNNVPPGTQMLTASATGFATTQVSISVVTGQTLTQNLSLSPALAAGEIRITLNWTKDAGNTPDDLDARLYGPAGNNECFYVFFGNQGSLTAAPFAALEVDNIEVTGRPPTETMRITQFRQGAYRFFVHNYSNEQADGLARSRATVQIFGSNGLLRSYTAPTGTGAYWNVFEINGQTGVITDLNQLANAQPPLTCGTQCTYSLTPTTQAFSASGGTGTVNVTTQTGCTRTATSNANWITITSGATGTGSGTVNYSVQANTTSQARSGTITIAGLTFTVTQVGTTTIVIVDQRLTGPPTPNSCTAPVNKTAYLTTDVEVWHWMRLRNTVQGDVVRWDFVQPSGAVYESTPFTLTAGGELCLWNNMTIAGSPAANLPGNWQVRIYYRNALLMTANFTLSRPPVIGQAHPPPQSSTPRRNPGQTTPQP